MIGEVRREGLVNLVDDKRRGSFRSWAGGAMQHHDGALERSAVRPCDLHEKRGGAGSGWPRNGRKQHRGEAGKRAPARLFGHRLLREVSKLPLASRCGPARHLALSQVITTGPMNSFRNRLLVLIIGLIAVTQTVTLVAVLASTRRNVEARAAEQLAAGGSYALQLVQFRASQLASGVAVLAADFGFREAVSSSDVPTILSAASNHSRRIDADLLLVVDTRGKLIASTEDRGPEFRRVHGRSHRSRADEPGPAAFRASLRPAVPVLRSPGAGARHHRVARDGLCRR